MKLKPKDPFTRIAGPTGATCGASWQHPSGYTVVHCGHPTALRPYYIVSPDGRQLYDPVTHQAFVKLQYAKDHVVTLAALQSEAGAKRPVSFGPSLCNIACGNCRHESDASEFCATPIGGELPPGHYQCPSCKRAWRIVKGKLTITSSWRIISEPNRTVFEQSAL